MQTGIRHSGRSSATVKAQLHQKVSGAEDQFGPYNHSQETISRIIEMMTVVPLFDQIHSDQISLIAPHMEIVELEDQQRLFSQGDDSHYICFIVSGVLDLFKQTQQGRTLHVSTLKRGHYVGDMALLDSYPRSATVKAGDVTTLLKMTRDSFELLLEQRPRTGMLLLKRLARGMSLYLRRTSGQLADLQDETGAATDPVADLSIQQIRAKKEKQSRLLDQLIRRKPSKLPPLIKQFI